MTSYQWQDVILRRRRSNIQVVTQLVKRTLSSSSWNKQETDSGDGKPLNSGIAQNEIKPGRNPNNFICITLYLSQWYSCNRQQLKLLEASSRAQGGYIL